MYRKKASQCLKEGRANEARECFQRCIECTPQMALDVIKVNLLEKKRSFLIVYFNLSYFKLGCA
jgi:hypothetical protein